MNILVCVKQVPDLSNSGGAPSDRVLLRNGNPGILNPFDSYALEAAARMRDQEPGVTITALSMGPLQAKRVLRECLSTAADQAFLISDARFGGSDSMVTGYILSHAVRKLEETVGKFDAVFCGRQAIDGDTGQVGPALAEYLGIPQVTCALEVEASGNGLRVTQETETGRSLLVVQTPCLLSFTKPTWELRYPTIQRIAAAEKADISVLSADSFPALESTRIGLKGSPTQVVQTFLPIRRDRGVKIKEKSDEASVKKLIRLLCDDGVL